MAGAAAPIPAREGLPPARKRQGTAVPCLFLPHPSAENAAKAAMLTMTDWTSALAIRSAAWTA